MRPSSAGSSLISKRLLPLLAVTAISIASPLSGTAAADKGPTIFEQQDVVYGRVDGAGLLADIAYPAGNGPFPAIVSVHGGRWRGGSKIDNSTIKVKQWGPSPPTSSR